MNSLTLFVSGIVMVAAAQLSSAELVITKPGDYQFGEEIKLMVKTHKDADGLVRNELTVTGKDKTGKPKSKRYALTFGESTWGLFVNKWKGTPGGIRVTLADRWAVQTFGVSTTTDDRYAPKANWSKSAEAVAAGKAGDDFDPAVRAWAKALLPTLKKEPAEAASPKFEVRLVAKANEKPAMVRPTFARNRSAHRRLGTFVALGERLVEGKEIEMTGAFTGVLHEVYSVTMDEEKFSKLMQKYDGCQAAFLKEGQVVMLLTLDSKMKRDGLLVTKY